MNFIFVLFALTIGIARSAMHQEFFNGCFWALRLKHTLCNHRGCFEAELLAHDLQRKFIAFYQEFGPPPIEETVWLLVGGRTQWIEIYDLCPGLVVTALLFQAELALGTMGMEAANEFERQAVELASALKDVDAVFPVSDAMISLQNARQKFNLETTRRNRSSDFVHFAITRCRGDMDWFRNITVPEDSRVFLYEKCLTHVNSTGLSESTLPGLPSHAFLHRVPYIHDEEDRLMTGECSGYLSYIIDHYDSLPDYVVLLHDDAPRHAQVPFLQMVMKSLQLKTYDAPFLHLNHERYAAMSTDCLRSVYEYLFDSPLKGRLGTYCCGQFVVSRKQIRSRNRTFYVKVLDGLRGGWFGKCSVGDKPCYVLEFLWQKIFSDRDNLPMRAHDERLPAHLRYDHGRETRLPSVLEQISPWQASHSSWSGPVVGLDY